MMRRNQGRRNWLLPDWNSSRMHPIKVAILHYQDDFRAGGSLRVGETIANHLNSAEVQAEIIFAYGGPGSVANNARVPCHFIDAQGRLDFAAWRRFRKLLRQAGFDIVHNVDGVGWMQLATAGLKVISLLHIHDRIIPERLKFKYRLLHSLLAKLTDAKVFISNATKRNHIMLGLSKPSNSYVVYNAINFDRFAVTRDKTACRQKLGIPDEVRVIGMVCRLTAAKGCLDLLRVLTRLPDYWHAAFTNDGPFRSKIVEFARLNNLESRIHMLGVQDDMATVYGSYDALGFFTYYEAFGLVMAEAMASRVPVFGLGAEGEYREPEFPLITDKNALFVERARPHEFFAPEEPAILDALAARIRDYGEHPEKYKEMIEDACDWVRTRFSANRQTRDLELVYETLTHKKN